ncbi:MAG: hypothetical protein IMY71_01945 [Bacteroidetes bacterium]|nr:hypothetical protein [Bacteroidota bacterium]
MEKWKNGKEGIKGIEGVKGIEGIRVEEVKRRRGDEEMRKWGEKVKR